MASVETFFKNADLLRLIARKEYLPDLRDVAHLASVNQRTRIVLVRTPDLILCREIHADTHPHKVCILCAIEGHAESFACSHVKSNNCEFCNGDFGKIACEALRGFDYALYERGNLRVARTFDRIVMENSTLVPEERLGVNFCTLLQNGHFEAAIECASKQEDPDTDDEECVYFFYYAMATVYDKQSVELAEQRLRETCKLMRHIPRETLNEIVCGQLRAFINTHGATEKIFLLLKRVADKIGNVLLDTARLIEHMVACSIDHFRSGQMQTIVENNANGLAYLVRTKQCLLHEIASVLERRVVKLSNTNRLGRRAHNVVYFVLVLLSQMHSNECDTALEWRIFFLSTAMQSVARTMFRMTAFSPLTAYMMDERDKEFRELVAEQFKDDPNIECIGEFLEETAVRGAMDRYLEFVAARLRDGLLYRQTESAALESPNKRQKI